MSAQTRRHHGSSALRELAPLLDLDDRQRAALADATAAWTFWEDGQLVGFATVRDRTLLAKRTVIARFTATHALHGRDARALRAAAARAFEAEVARERPGLRCHWVSDARTVTRMSPRARAAAGDAIAVLSAHLDWAGLNNCAPLRRVG